MSNVHILIVEDESLVAESIQYMLQRLGYTVLAVASSGEEAIRQVEQTQPDLVLMDIALPGRMDGVQAAEVMRSRFDIPVIYLTAYADDATLDRAKLTRPFGYLVKPFQKSELHTTIEVALYKHEMEKRLYAQMQRNAEELEQHVAERTAELRLTNEQLQREIAERKQAEETLRRYEHIVSATPDLMALLDTNYVYQAVNDTYLKAYRKGRDEIIGHSVVELLGADVFENLLKKHLERCRKGLATNYEAWLTYPGRGRRSMSVSYYPYCDAQQAVTGIVVSARDITDLKRAEEALRRSETKYRAIFAVSPDFIFLTDVTGRFLEANPAFLKWAGLSPEELQQRYFMHFFAGERVEKIQAYVANIKYGQDVRQLRVRIKNTRGEVLESEMDAVPFQENGEVTTVLNVARDVTERVRAEQALREGEEKYRALFEASTDAILLVTLDGHVVDCNATACKTYGYALEDLIGLAITDLVSEEMAAKLPEAAAEVLSVGNILMQANARRQDGSLFPVEVSTRLVTFGGTRLVVIYVRDVSDKVQIEKALQETVHQLKTALRA